MNHMDKVASILGVEIGEEFDIKDSNSVYPLYNPYRLTPMGLEGSNNILSDLQLVRLLCNDTQIVKKSKNWKPKQDEKYWFVYFCGGTKYISYEEYEETDISDKTRYKIGNCYRTAEEAEVNAEKWKNWYASDETVDVFGGNNG